MKNESTTNSRRDFIRKGSAASAVAAIGMSAVHTSAAAKPSTAANEMVTIGLIGAGGRGTGASNDSMTINENVKLISIADLFPEKLEQARKGLSARHKDKVAVVDNKMHSGLDAYKKVIADPDVDLVLLTTSPGFRPYMITEAVDAKKHVFAEKPTCVDPAGYRLCLEAHKAAEAQKTAIVTGTQYRRQSNYVEAVQMIHDGAIGDIISATTRYCASGIWYRGRKDGMTDAEYQMRNWMHFIWLSGDQITEQAVHNIDAMNWVMGGPPESAYGSGGSFTRPEDSEMWDNISLDYVYPGNRVLSFMCRQIPNTKGDNGNVIYGTKGTVHIHAGSGGSEVFDREGNLIKDLQGSIADAYKQEHKDLVDSIRSGNPIVELNETADASLTASMGRMAAYTGQLVTWDFVTKESKLDTMPKNLTMDTKIESLGHAVPGETKLI